MARMERETRSYITWLPFLIDSIRWRNQGWYIGEKEHIRPRSKLLAPLALAFPVLRVTYERIVAGGIMYPLPHYPSQANDPRYAAAFIAERARLETSGMPLPTGSSTTKLDPLLEDPVALAPSISED